MVVGGYQNIDKSQLIDVSSSTTCSNLPPYPLPLYGATGGVINGIPIICGGTTSGGRTNTCYSFEKTSNSWKLHCSLKSKRSHHASTVINDALLITGGHDDGSILASTEFIYANGTTQSGPNMPVARWEHCMVTLHDGKVMILGSYDPASLHKNVIIMDPATNSFSSGPSLNYVRRDAGCTLFNSALHNGRPVVLAAGGYTTDTAEVYDYTNANQWETSIIHFVFLLIM